MAPASLRIRLLGGLDLRRVVGLGDGRQPVGDPGPGEGDQLALPGGQEGAALADLGVVAVGQARR